MGYLGTKPANSPLTSELIPDGLISTSDLANSAVTIAKISATGTPSSSNYLRGDGSWQTVAGYTNADALTLFNASGSAPVYACRAWVNFNGTGTVAIRGSGNVSSITDNGVGNYTVNFANAMPDANYAISSIGAVAANFLFILDARYASGVASTTQYQVITANVNGSAQDPAHISITIHR